MLVFSNLLIAQNDELPSLETLYQSIQDYYLKEANAQLLEFQESQKGEWLKYVPNIGFGYTIGTKEVEGSTQIVGRLRPSVSLNTSILYQAKKGKQLRAAKIKSIESSVLLLIQEEQRKLLQLYSTYQRELRSLALATEIQEIEEQIFRIQESKYNSTELTPLQFLPIKRSYLQKQYDLAEKRKGIELMVGELLFLGKWGHYLRN